MNASLLVLYLIPAEAWVDGGAISIAPFVRDAMAIERRLAKGVRLDKERTRYRLCCGRIQESVRRRATEFEACTLGTDYLELLATVDRQRPAEFRQGRLAACFFPPDGFQGQWISAQINFLESLGVKQNPDAAKRRSFFEKARQEGAGVVEMLDLVWDDRPAPDQPFLPAVEQKARAAAADSLTVESRQGLEALLRTRVETAMASGTTVNVSSQPHFILSEVLRHFVYKHSPDNPEAQVRIVYLDGSSPAPFPMRILSPPADDDGSEELPVIRAALVSMRHLALDEGVDLAWFRNSKVSVPQPGALIEDYCARETQQSLAAHRDRPLEIHLYQTGLETAVIGFYRGLAAELQERRNLKNAAFLQVVPFYHLGPEKGLRQGTPWR